MPSNISLLACIATLVMIGKDLLIKSEVSLYLCKMVLWDAG